MALNLAALIYGTCIVPSEVAYGIDFKGGANLQMELSQPSDAPTIRSRLAADPKFSEDFRNVQVNTVESDAASRSTLFNIRLKLHDAMREQITEDRRLAREARKAAEAKGEEPPPPYVPPYVAQLKTIFSADLVKPAFSDPKVDTGPNGGDAYADIKLHLQAPVELAKLQETLVHAKLPGVTVSDPNDATATQGKDLRIQWVTLPTTRASALAETVRDALLDTKNVKDQKLRLTDVAGHAVKLSDPFPEAEEIQGRMVGELRTAAIGALILSWLLIALYLRVRFHEYKYGIAAVISLLHDVLMAFGAVVVFNRLGIVHAEIDLNMIACFLTIIGYSVNDTIVIFDRIRENLNEDRKMGGHMSLREVINLSVNQTMSRTILTSGVTSFVVLAQLIVNWGTTSDLFSFAFGMLVGIATGTYSSVFIAAPILVWIADRDAKKQPPTPAPAAAPVAAQ
jgi:preprotein translocase SecF subunit